MHKIPKEYEISIKEVDGYSLPFDNKYDRYLREEVLARLKAHQGDTRHLDVGEADCLLLTFEPIRMFFLTYISWQFFASIRIFNEVRKDYRKLVICPIEQKLSVGWKLPSSYAMRNLILGEAGNGEYVIPEERMEKEKLGLVITNQYVVTEMVSLNKAEVIRRFNFYLTRKEKVVGQFFTRITGKMVNWREEYGD